MRLSRGLIIGLSLVVASLTAIGSGGYLLSKIGQEAVLRAKAEVATDRWVSYIEHVVPELAEIASGAAPSDSAMMFLAHGIDTSSVINYRLYDRQGELRAAAGAGAYDAIELERSRAGVLAVLGSGQALLEMGELRSDDGQRQLHISSPDSRAKVRSVQKDEDSAPHDGQAGMHHHHLNSMDMSSYSAPVVPVAPSDFVTTFFHPIFSGDRLSGVLQIEIDQEAIARSFSSTFQALSAGLTLIMGLAVAPPFFFGWHKSMQRARAERKVRHLAYHDPLTHVPNRRYAHEEIDKRLRKRADSRESMALLCLDLDGFKAINDAFGHAAGDDLLRQAVHRLTAQLESGDMLARLGGDEFLILPKLGMSPKAVQSLAANIIETLCMPFVINNQETSCGVSIGIVIADASWENRDQLLRAGDVALYEAKAGGRRRAVLFEPRMEERLRKRREIENDLRLAVARDELILHYQPQFDVRTKMLTGFEALVRWQHPTQGLLPPSEFIQVAEELKLIGAISRWVMLEACQAATSWARPLKIAVNVSAIEFEEGNLVSTVQEALATSGLTPERLEIEITETVIMTNTDLVIRTLNSIRDLGVSVAMDDFGTGYSSLGYLCKFPFDKLKIDRSFLLSDNRQKQSKRIVEAIITLGHSLDLNVVAEGVEHQEQLAMLESLSCSEAQGFLLGKPMVSAEAKMLVDKQVERTASDAQISVSDRTTAR
jgi:diguanylate cyclase (GGDEF)-like protein